MSPLLQVQNLTVTFRDHCAVRGVNLSVNSKETVGIIGESGCGKSVTAQAIIRLLDPTSAKVEGKILINETDLLALDESAMQQHRGRTIGMIFQDPMTSLNPTMTIGTQIGEGIRCHDSSIGRKAVREHTLELLKMVGISDPEARIDLYPHHFSGGMRQRVMIAIALACRPLLLIADEPTTSLDVTIQAQILELIKKVQKELGMALLLISHDLGVIAGTCDAVAVMHQGAIVEYGTVEEIFYHPQHEYTKILLKIKGVGSWTH